MEGYICKPPSKQAEEIDSDTVSSMRCPKCGGRMAYEPWTNEKGSYIALAVCVKRTCKYKIEF